MRQTLWLFLVVFSLAVLPLQAQVSDTAIVKARAAAGSKVIRCSPDGADGTLKPLQALAQLKRGMELVLLPGAYETRLEIVPDRVIVRGEGVGKCRLSLTISGKDCIVRDLCFNELSLSGGSATIMDCMLRGVTLTGEDSRRKARHALYNCGVRSIQCFAYSAKLEVRNCTLISEDVLPPSAPAAAVVESEYGTIYCTPESELNIENSVLYANGVLFHFRVFGRRQPKLVLKNNLIFGKGGLGRVYGDSSGDKSPKVSFDLKDFRRQANISLQGETLSEEPVFVPATGQDTPPESPRRIRCGGLYLEQFLLTAESPGTGRGLIPAEHPFLDKPSTVAAPSTEEAPPEPPLPPPPPKLNPDPAPDKDPATDVDPAPKKDPALDKDPDKDADTDANPDEDEDVDSAEFGDILIPPPPPPQPPPGS